MQFMKETPDELLSGKGSIFCCFVPCFNLQLQGKLYKPMHINLEPTLTNFPALDVSDSLQEPHLNLHELDKSFTNVIQPHS